MKKVIIAIIALAVLATAVVFAVAQRSGHDGHAGRGFHRGGGMGMAFRALDLTDEQKAQVKQIFESSKTKTQSLREALKANRQKLNEATANGAFDEAAVAALAAEKGNLSAQMTVETARAQSQIFALLTDAQKAKLAEMKAKRGERFKERKEAKAEKISE